MLNLKLGKQPVVENKLIEIASQYKENGIPVTVYKSVGAPDVRRVGYKIAGSKGAILRADEFTVRADKELMADALRQRC